MTSDSINKTYLSVRSEINELKIPKKEKIFAFLISLVTSLLLILGPIALSANLFAFIELKPLALLLIILFIDLGALITNMMTLKLITRGRVNGLYHIYIVDFLYLSIILLVIFLGILKLGVM